jgi:uncharacterized protein YbbC (DUF1343 family)
MKKPYQFILVICCFGCVLLQAQTERVITGAERLYRYMPMLKNRQIGLVINQSSVIGNTHLVDTLCALDNCVARIYAPEHGFRGQAEAGETIHDGQDARTGTPIISLYGRKKKPTTEDLAGVDLMIFDIQDVGARFYTYISTLFYVMEACAENNIPLIVLDRPNPNGFYVDGPVLDTRLESFVGVAPLPIVHGCTVGELARLFVGEGWINRPDKLKLTVIPCQNYTHQTPYDLPVKPSPNLPNARSVLLYPSLCLFEGTVMSIGRGTDSPFQVIGHPDFPIDSFSFVPHSTAAAKYPLHQGWKCKGVNLGNLPIADLRAQTQLDLHWLLYFYENFPNQDQFFLKNNFFDLLAGTRQLRLQIQACKTEAEIRAGWAEDLTFFRKIRLGYLLYP